MRSPILRANGSRTPIDKSLARAWGLHKQIEDLGPDIPAEDIGVIRNQSIWVEIPLTEQWLAAFRLVNKAGVPVVAELRVFPAEPDPHRERTRPAGQWRGQYGGPEGVPRAGLTARQIHQIRSGTWKDVLRKVLPRDGEALASLKDFWPDLPQAHPQPVRRGRKGRPDAELAAIAAVYEKAYLAKAPPVLAIAKRFRLSLSQARDVIHRARVRGILTPAEKQGSAGGFLTARAQALLDLQRKGGTRHGAKR